MTANVVINTTQSVLNQTPKAFNGVGVNVAHDIDLLAVIDAPMCVPALRDIRNAFIAKMFVSENNALGKNMLFNHGQKDWASRSFACKGSDFAFALDHANDHCFVLPVVPSADATGAAKIRLIDFHARAILATNRIRFVIRKHRTNLFKHAPCGLVSHARLALNLFRGNAAASRSHEVDRIEPRREWGWRFVKNCLRRGMKVVAAVVARIGWATDNAMMFGFLPALVTERHPVWMEAAKQPLKAGHVIWKLFSEVVDCVGFHIRLAIVVWHGDYLQPSMPEMVPTVKG